MGRFLSQLEGHLLDSKSVSIKLIEPLIYKTKHNDLIIAPIDYITDLASVPRLFWRIFPPFGRYNRATVIHDICYDARLFTRKVCDKIFLEAMKDLKVNKIKRYLMYKAVRIFGKRPWYNNSDRSVNKHKMMVVKAIKEYESR